MALLNTGCANNQWDDSGPTGGVKQTVGTLLGAVGGGVLGAQIGSGTGQIAAAIGGTIVGGLLGGYIGKGLDDTDKLMAERNAQESLEHAPTGSTTQWHNPDTGRSGEFTIDRTYAYSDGDAYTRRPCREYSTTVTIDGEKRKAFGEACRHDDGSWEIISQKFVSAELQN
ncbi:MAG: RT0821/Lpp0805 family surface protein [Pseudomonadota bacterium]